MMTMPIDSAEAVIESSEADRLRAGTWTMLGRLLIGEPSADMLRRLCEIEPPSAEADLLAQAWAGLREAARKADPAALQIEFQDVFVGLGGGEVTPYASWYLTGTLMDRPLVQLREDLDQLGFAADEHCREPEDHAAAVCEIMALVIHDEDVDFDWQKDLFRRHVASWMERFLKDVAAAPSANFYRAVAALGQALLNEERKFYEMPA